MGLLNGGSSNHKVKRMFRKWESFEVREHEGDVVATAIMEREMSSPTT
jgi:hypothetical protein